MNKEDAEEYTQSLGQILAGSWRQILWAQKQGIPKALGMSTEEWVNGRLGGYVKMTIPERREAVKEIKEQEGLLSNREIAKVLGVKPKTIDRDVRASNVAMHAGNPPESATNVAPIRPKLEPIEINEPKPKVRPSIDNAKRHAIAAIGSMKALQQTMGELDDREDLEDMSVLLRDLKEQAEFLLIQLGEMVL